MTMRPFTFQSDGILCSGQIVAAIGEALVVEGMALDSGSHFLKLGEEFRRFDSHQEAVDYAKELAQDAEPDWKVGNKVHLGFGAKGGAGFRGVIQSVDDDGKVTVKTSEGKTYRGPTRLLSKDSEFGERGMTSDPLTEKGEEIKRAMEKQYGPEKGKQVFYASKNKGTITGVGG